jgi:hypothetical protein
MNEQNFGKPATRVRGRPFARGNSGRPKGARNKTTLLAERLLADDVVEIVNAVRDAAKSGDMTAARIILDRVAPPRKGRLVEFGLPTCSKLSDFALAVSAILTAVSQGEITVEEATALTDLLDMQRKVIASDEVEKRLSAVEARVEKVRS